MSLTLADLDPEDLDEISDILIQYKGEGIENPLLPSDFDLDGDGIVDAFGLNDRDQVIVVSGVKLTDTVHQLGEENKGNHG